MKKSYLLFVLFLYGSIIWASENQEMYIQKMTQEFQKMESRITPQVQPGENIQACLLTTGLPFRTPIQEKNERFVWYLLPEYYFDDKVDSSGTIRLTTLDYRPIEKVFNLFPALYGVWMSEPVSSLTQQTETFINVAKSTAGSSFTELINKSESYYSGIPGVNFCYRYRTSLTNYVWFSHLLWKDGVGYNIFFLTRESDYNISLNQTYFQIVLALVSFSQDAAVAGAPFSVSPKTFSLEQNYPNPFNGTTIIRFQLHQSTPVQLKIFNTLGQEIRHFNLENRVPGQHELPWDGRNNLGEMVPSGIYFYRLQSDLQQQVGQMSFIR